MTVMRADLLSQPGSAAPDRDHPAQRHGGAASGYGELTRAAPRRSPKPCSGPRSATWGRSTGQRARRGCADRIRSGAGGHFRIEHGTHRHAGTRRPRRCGCDMVGGQRGGRTRWAAWTGRVLAHGGRRRLHVRGRSRVSDPPVWMATGNKNVQLQAPPAAASARCPSEEECMQQPRGCTHAASPSESAFRIPARPSATDRSPPAVEPLPSRTESPSELNRRRRPLLL